MSAADSKSPETVQPTTPNKNSQLSSSKIPILPSTSLPPGKQNEPVHEPTKNQIKLVDQPVKSVDQIVKLIEQPMKHEELQQKQVEQSFTASVLASQTPVTTSGLLSQTLVTTSGPPSQTPVIISGPPDQISVTTSVPPSQSPVTTSGQPVQTPVTTSGPPSQAPATTSGQPAQIPVITSGSPPQTPFTTSGPLSQTPVITSGPPSQTPITTSGTPVITNAPINVAQLAEVSATDHDKTSTSPSLPPIGPPPSTFNIRVLPAPTYQSSSVQPTLSSGGKSVLKKNDKEPVDDERVRIKSDKKSPHVSPPLLPASPLKEQPGTTGVPRTSGVPSSSGEPQTRLAENYNTN